MLARGLLLVTVISMTVMDTATSTSQIRHDPDRLIRFESATLNPARALAFDAEPYPTAVQGAAQFTFVVELTVMATESERLRLSSQYGAEAGGYLPHSAYLFYGTVNQMKAMADDIAVRWIGNLHPRYKMSLTLSQYKPTTTRTRFFSVPDLGSPISQLVVSLTASDAVAIARLRRAPGVTSVTVIDGVRVVVDVEYDLDVAAAALADDPAVHWVERRLRHQFMNRWARSIMQKSNVNVTADYRARTGLLSWDQDLDGTGQILGLGDSGVDKHSCFFASRRTCTTPTSRSRLFPVESDLDTSDKIVAYISYADSEDITGHGTHLAGTMVGDPHAPDGVRTTLPSFAGMAPGARLAVIDIGDDGGVVQLPLDLNLDYFHPMYEVGARIMTCAWGASLPLYTHEAATLDHYMNQHHDFLVITAAGNDGACNDEMTIVSPATSKNSIAVGATLSLSMQYQKTDLIPPGFHSVTDPALTPNTIAPFSAKGPTADGRIKPDVLAPGYFVYSAGSGRGPNHCAGDLGAVVTPNAGTSTAAAVLAGTAALVRQYLTDGFYPGGRRDRRHGFQPSAALLKAVLVHGARLMNGSRMVGDEGVREPPRCPRTVFAPLLDDGAPNIDQGWGRPQLDQVLGFVDHDMLHLVGRNNKSIGTFGDPEIRPGQQHRFRFCVLESQTAVRATLVWTDPAATLGAGLQLVNDLDLVLDLNGDLRYGNDAAETGGDRRNPVERVDLVTSRPLTDLTVAVHARRIARGLTQPYALVVTGHGLRSGPCRAHHEMLRVLSGDDRSATLDGAVRLLNTARGLLARHHTESGASRTRPPLGLAVLGALLLLLLLG